MMNIEITKSTKELTKVEQVKIARSKTALSLDEVSKEKTKNGETFTMRVDNFIVLHIVNDGAKKEEDKDFIRYMIQTDGVLYFTRSQAFAQEFMLLTEMMEGEDFNINVVRVVSSETGKDYLSCEIA